MVDENFGGFVAVRKGYVDQGGWSLFSVAFHASTAAAGSALSRSAHSAVLLSRPMTGCTGKPYHVVDDTVPSYGRIAVLACSQCYWVISTDRIIRPQGGA